MWYLTLHRWLGDRDTATDRSLDDHLAWMREQQLAGKVLFSGPSLDGELGIIVFGHMSRAELDDLCRQEPFVARGYRGFEVIPWEVHQLLGIGGFDVETLTAMTRFERT
ncbi:YciI family protein [Nocardia sp. NPDC004604]|uniref:YciI family protein n=1 Tax=Nocardia sp. NPDC004604 TaxID=3157013 RepID=UPI0033BBA396